MLWRCPETLWYSWYLAPLSWSLTLCLCSMNWSKGEGQAMTPEELSARPASHMALRMLFMVCPGGTDNKLNAKNPTVSQHEWSAWWATLPEAFLPLFQQQLRPHDVIKAIKRWLPVSCACGSTCVSCHWQPCVAKV